MTDRERILALREGYAEAVRDYMGGGIQLKGDVETTAAAKYELPKLERPREVNGWRCARSSGDATWRLEMRADAPASEHWADWASSRSVQVWNELQQGWLVAAYATDADRLAIARVCAEPMETVDTEAGDPAQGKSSRIEVEG